MVEGATGIPHVEVRDAAKHPILHRAAPTTKKYVVLNVNNAKVEKC